MLSITDETLRLVRLALYQLRQDVGVPDSVTDASTDTSSVWLKCKSYLQTSFSSVLNAHNWTWKRGASGAGSVVASVDNWPEEVKGVFVYHLAKELAVPVAGRVEDLKNLSAIYDQKLQEARIHDLNNELDAITDVDHKEILSAVCPTITTSGSALPMDLISVTRRIEANKAHAMAEIIAYHNWSFCRDEIQVGSSLFAPDDPYPYLTDLPANCVRPLDCRGVRGRRLDWKIVGHAIRSTDPIDTILYIRNEDRLDKWPPLVRATYVARLVADIAATVAGSASEAERLRLVFERTLENAKLADSRGTGTHGEQRGRNVYVEAMIGRASRGNPFGRTGW